MSNRLIAEIHGSFSASEDLILQQAQNHLKHVENADNSKHFTALSELGFSNFKEKVQFQPKQIERTKRLYNRMVYNRDKYPFYKFITKDKVIELCRKYALVHAPTQLYVDTLPSDVQQSVIDYKLHKADRGQNLFPFINSTIDQRENHYWRDANGDTLAYEDLETSHIINIIKYVARNEMKYIQTIESASNKIALAIHELVNRGEMQHESLMEWTPYRVTQKVPDIFDPTAIIDITSEIHVRAIHVYKHLFQSPDQTYCKPYLSIVAARHMLNLKGYNVDENYQVIERIVPAPTRWFDWDDPIILSSVTGGFHIVKAFGGDEASDPDVVNEVMN